MPKTTYDHIASNNFKTWILIFSFPLSLLFLFFAILYIGLFATTPEPVDNALILEQTIYYTKHFGIWMFGIGFVWMLFVLNQAPNMMLGFAKAKELKRGEKENRHIYLLVENTALAAGLPCPKIYVINDDSLNAFATGMSPQNSAVALTSGIIKKLSPMELQGVIAHEMAHIGNRDCKLHGMIISGLSIFGFLAEMLMRVKFSSSKSNNSKGSIEIVFLAVMLTLFVFHFLVAPLLKFAVLRTREYAADATAALITRNPQALADALRKISKDSRVEVLDSASQMAIACIQTPLKKEAFSLSQTHPPIQDRIKRLEEMAGRISI